MAGEFNFLINIIWFHDLSIFQDTILIYDDSMNYGNVIETNTYAADEFFFTWRIPVVAFAEDNSLQRVYGPCMPKDIFLDFLSTDEWLNYFLPTFITHFISISFLLLIILFHVAVKELRRNKFGIYWTTFAVLSTLNYSYIIVFGIILTTQNLTYEQVVYEIQNFPVFFIFEYTVFFWLLIICFELFLSIGYFFIWY